MGDGAFDLLGRYGSLLPGEPLGSMVVDRGERDVAASRLPDGRCLVAYAEEAGLAEGKTRTIGTDEDLPDATGSGLAVRYVREARGAFDAGREFERLSKLLVQEHPEGAREAADEEPGGGTRSRTRCASGAARRSRRGSSPSASGYSSTRLSAPTRPL